MKTFHVSALYIIDNQPVVLRQMFKAYSPAQLDLAITSWVYETEYDYGCRWVSSLISEVEIMESSLVLAF
jgi:hypothetical protein